jgi:hypothetical protein
MRKVRSYISYNLGLYLEINAIKEEKILFNAKEIRKKCNINDEYDEDDSYNDALLIDCDIFSNSNFFKYTDKIKGVPYYSLDADNDFLVFNDLDFNNEDILENVQKDKKFMIVAAKLKKEFGDNFKIHFGLYTTCS